MRKDYQEIIYECRQCEKTMDVRVYPIIPAQTYGPAESCHPEEGGEIEPEECEHCGHKVNQDAAYELANEKANDERDAYLEAKYEARRTGD